MNFPTNYNNLIKYNYPSLKTRICLKDMQMVLNPSLQSTTKLDVMFNENKLVKSLDKFSLFIKQDIINKHFENPTNIISKKCRAIQEKGVKYSRILADKIFFLSNFSAIRKLNKTFVKMNPNSQEYIEELAKVGNTMDKKFIVTNIENNTLENISKSKNATIFVLNHPNYHKDKFTYVILNAMLNKLYVKQGKQIECPRPKIIVSKNMLKMLGTKIGEIYKKLGLIEVDASLKNRNTKSNTTPMRNLLKEFVTDKSNIFIFPEGNNSSYKNKTMEEKIQPGVAEFIKTAVKLKNSVRVVPIGIKYTENKNNFGNIFIGKPIYLKQSQNDIIYTEGTDKKKISHININESVPVIIKEICKNIKHGMQKASELN